MKTSIKIKISGFIDIRKIQQETNFDDWSYYDPLYPIHGLISYISIHSNIFHIFQISMTEGFGPGTGSQQCFGFGAPRRSETWTRRLRRSAAVAWGVAWGNIWNIYVYLYNIDMIYIIYIYRYYIYDMYIYVYDIYIYIYIYIYIIHSLGYVWIEWNIWNIRFFFSKNGAYPHLATNGKNGSAFI